MARMRFFRPYLVAAISANAQRLVRLAAFNVTFLPISPKAQNPPSMALQRSPTPWPGTEELVMIDALEMRRSPECDLNAVFNALKRDDQWTVQSHIDSSLSAHSNVMQVASPTAQTNALRVPSPLASLTIPDPHVWLDKVWDEMKRSDRQRSNAFSRGGNAFSRSGSSKRLPLASMSKLSGITKRRPQPSIDDAVLALRRCQLNTATPCTTLAIWQPPPSCRTRCGGASRTASRRWQGGGAFPTAARRGPPVVDSIDGLEKLFSQVRA